jgi:hypothetical protein
MSVFSPALDLLTVALLFPTGMYFGGDFTLRTDKELWTSNYTIYKLKVHLGTVLVSTGRKTDLLDWYPNGHKNKVIDARKYYNQSYHYLKIGSLNPAPEFLISLSDLSARLVVELAEFDKVARNYILKQAVALIFQEINSELYHNSVSSVLRVKPVE